LLYCKQIATAKILDLKEEVECWDDHFETFDFTKPVPNETTKSEPQTGLPKLEKNKVLPWIEELDEADQDPEENPEEDPFFKTDDPIIESQVPKRTWFERAAVDIAMK
jgi:hypothetical protein